MRDGVAVRRVGAVLVASGLLSGIGASTSADAVPRGVPPALAATFASRTAAPRWSWPVDPPHAVTRRFEAPSTPYGPGHRGIDIAVGPGTAVHSPADGIVSFAGVVVDRPVVSIQHADGLVSSMEPVVPGVSTGDAVSAGQVVGVLAEGPRHEPDGGLHLGARLHGAYVDPQALLAGLRHAVLLPLDP
ncbi:M23 family peptidase [Clavibacter michiganensis]|uniref:murein hydrolase activator EnvC family protein n=1 Tax=Clavibacter michiganensis TaxID=28447 RepID=UPI000CE919B4|nr:M23 family metallopeptidase [Clavibacter michiganensis]PPF57750.1 M23 family peptidase [Clavibacter michiganensis]